MPWLPLAILLIAALTAAALLLIIFPPGDDPPPSQESPAASRDTSPHPERDATIPTSDDVSPPAPVDPPTTPDSPA